MMKSFVKSLGVGVAAVGAIAICGFGYMYTQKEQTNQQVSYAQSAINSQKEQLQSVKKSIQALYQDSATGILANTTAKETVETLNNTLAGIQTSAESFGINEQQLPQGMQELDSEKKALVSELQMVREKVTLQTKISQLFSEAVDWQNYNGAIVVKETTTPKMISELKDQVSILNADNWQTLANQYLTEASQQQSTISDIQASLDKMYQNGTVTDAATLEEYTTLVTAIDAVKNQTIRQTFVQTLNAINDQMGFGMPAQ